MPERGLSWYEKSFGPREQIWYVRLCRRLGVSPVVGVLLDPRAQTVAHELLSALADPSRQGECAELFAELEAHKRRIEDAHAARLGMPRRPRT